jgi:hypothetical protein
VMLCETFGATAMGQGALGGWCQTGVGGEPGRRYRELDGVTAVVGRPFW